MKIPIYILTIDVNQGLSIENLPSITITSPAVTIIEIVNTDYLLKICLQ